MNTKDRHPGVTVRPELLHHLDNTHLDVQKIGAGAWCHDLNDLCFVRLQKIIDQGAFCGIELTPLCDLLNQRQKLIDIQYVLGTFVFSDYPRCQPVRGKANDPAQRRNKPYP